MSNTSDPPSIARLQEVVADAEDRLDRLVLDWGAVQSMAEADAVQQMLILAYEQAFTAVLEALVPGGLSGTVPAGLTTLESQVLHAAVRGQAAFQVWQRKQGADQDSGDFTRVAEQWDRIVDLLQAG